MGTKNSLFGSFWDWNLKRMLLYLKLAFSDLSVWKIFWKNEMPKFETKIPYLGIFGLEFWKTISVFEISTLKLVKNEFLTHTGSAFSKGRGAAFSEGPVSGPSLLHKICYFVYHFLKCCCIKSWQQSIYQIIRAVENCQIVNPMILKVLSSYM